MKRFQFSRDTAVVVWLALFSGACRSASPPVTTPPAEPTTLQARLDSITATPPFDRALWGVRVEDDDGTVIYDRDSTRLFVPGSARKLFVAAAVADCYGFDSTIPTRFLITGNIRDGALAGDVVIEGFGDPSIAGRLEYDTDRNRRFRPLLEWMRSAGVTRIAGGITADVSAFDADTIQGSWKSDNIGDSYAAPVDALAFNENVVGIRIRVDDCSHLRAVADPAFVPVTVSARCGEMGASDVQFSARNEAEVSGIVPAAGTEILGAVADPALYTAAALADFLRNEGIVIDGPLTVSRVKVPGRVVAEGESEPLFALLAIVLKNSQNLYAGMLFKRLAIGERPASYGLAAEVERHFLEDVPAIAADDFSFQDGSGLSDENLVTPAALVSLLRYFNSDINRRGVFWSLLARPGEEGTLSHRLLSLSDRLRAKSGSLHMVNVLAGYVVSAIGGRIRYFSIMLNHHTATGSKANGIIDEIVTAVADF
ncbi:MAG TPA: D-alanyl-D-alanine carboxypeptidase/D-alanyl-D-alanine-endopeptidase [Thermoanaerobaculia bacterium]|nr:D-alanyl-D-alanine carboxypeptidase/D-alanyl-D-alanine-endopeptidase [Thermoanaerobaculia bacterium]